MVRFHTFQKMHDSQIILASTDDYENSEKKDDILLSSGFEAWKVLHILIGTTLQNSKKTFCIA